MSKQANPTLIGGFVVGAILLAIAGLAIFGAGEFFKERRTYVTYFSGSVRGLSVGSPVEFRGVKIGEVSEIRIVVDRKNVEVTIPVVLEIDHERMVSEEDFHTSSSGTGVPIPVTTKQLIDAGLRAKLVPLSIITGQLAVELAFRPGTPARIVDPDSALPEIPTVPSDLEEIGDTVRRMIDAIEKIPISQLVDQLNHTFQSVNGLLDSAEVNETVVALHEALVAVRDAAKTLDRETPVLAERVGETAEAATAALQQAEGTLATLDQTAAADSPLQYQLDETLKATSEAAHSVRLLSDYLQEHPEAVLRGKREGGK